MNERVSIIYFSGTGGVRRIAHEFDRQLKEKRFSLYLCELDMSRHVLDYDEIDDSLRESRYVFLLFPVHAFDAPDPIYRWINAIKATNNNLIVISVSGGGAVWPNIGTRVDCITALEKKRFRVIYDTMMVMPSNWAITANDHVAMWLIRVIPEKVKRIIDAVLSGMVRRTSIRRKGFFLSFITKLEKRHAPTFGKTLSIDDNCTHCKWCIKNCPTRNIQGAQERPVFLEHCIMCFRCIYGCPANAIRSHNFQVLKQGYNLDAVEKRMKDIELEPIHTCCKGVLWSGVKKYLLDEDGY